MIAAPEFARMKKKPLVINCGRGGLVNEADLVEALDRGQIAGIGFDCLTLKPPKAENPLDCRVPDSPSMVLRMSGGNPAITPLRVIALVTHGLIHERRGGGGRRSDHRPSGHYRRGAPFRLDRPAGNKKLTILPATPLLAQTIRRLHEERSLTDLGVF